MSADVWPLLLLAAPAGGIVGAGWSALARRLPAAAAALPARGRCGRAWLRTARATSDIRTAGPGLDPAWLAGAAVPLAAWMLASGWAAVVVAAVLWLLLGIAICDLRTLHIPHALWIAPLVIGLGLAGWAGGWHGVAARVAAVAVLGLALLACARIARRSGGPMPVGGADHGVLACVAALCGVRITLDALLSGAVLALGFLLVSSVPGPRRPIAWLLAAASTVASLVAVPWGALAGVAVSALALRFLGRRRRRSPPVPFGACLVAAAVCVVAASRLSPSPGHPLRDDPVLRHLLPLTAEGR